ncbi:levanase/fructan beta-fructosidase [Lutibacter oricola]|uniref:Levanase/fructan beta-fructosidase n=1 Tax=Lutibacter oricola TaxID=762486 RepID=A0A1H3D873_9FLAO|nr:glycoside hydrolase family 32 protein [Lutibacter oricola]SDX62605.1 levanase/fructan beta-fructosidase [Lutibacter oricola]
MKEFKVLFVVFIGLIITIGCKEQKTKQDVSNTVETKLSEEQLYRPNFHFTPKANWMNDPNGMFFYNGYYHLYFQYYPDGNVWGPMHWGHAISTDMVTWVEKPIALYPDEKGYIFSGSAVVDADNTSGFGKGGKIPTIAMFTYHNMDKEKNGDVNFQSQAIAYSLDEGLTWEKYADNPVIKNPNIKDFRDPKVVWDEVNEKWIMVLAAGQEIMFYSSKNLKDWELLSNFGENIGSHDGVWECPDLFAMQVEGTDEVKWVLIVSVGKGGYNMGSATQYFVGDFDGKNFTIDPDFKNELDTNNASWIDYGKDNYAGVTWSNIPDTDGRKLFIGWMSNWQYATKVPTEKWRSSMTVARELKLTKTNNKYQLKSVPVKEISNYISKTVKKNSINIEKGKQTLLTNKKLIDFKSLDIQFTIKNLKEDTYTFCFDNKSGDAIKFGLNNNEQFFFIDRMVSGNVSFSEEFAPKISKAPFTTTENELEVRLLLDKTSIEIFYNNGETVMTEIFFPKNPIEAFSVQSENFNIEIENLIINELNFN